MKSTARAAGTDLVPDATLTLSLILFALEGRQRRGGELSRLKGLLLRKHQTPAGGKRCL